MKFFKAVILLVAVTVMFGLPLGLCGDEKDLPFRPGEKLTFQLRWTIVPAGESTLEVLPMKTIDGIKAYHFLLTAESNSFVDIFYKVRDRIDAFVNADVTHSILYKKKQREGNSHRDIVVKFDWRNKKAQYTNFNEKLKPIDILPGSFDPLSAFYFIRLIDFKGKSSTPKMAVWSA